MLWLTVQVLSTNNLWRKNMSKDEEFEEIQKQIVSRMEEARVREAATS